jgi:hypothetical protein
MILKTSVGCENESTLNGIREDVLDQEQVDLMKINLDLMAKSCRVFTPSDKVEAINYTSSDDVLTTVKVMDKKNQTIYYMFRKNLRIEQPGTKNIIQFN